MIIKGLVSKAPKKKKKPKDKKEETKRSEEKEEESSTQKKSNEIKEGETLQGLKDENAQLKAELDKMKLKEVNNEANKPSSKQAEWGSQRSRQ